MLHSIAKIIREENIICNQFKHLEKERSTYSTTNEYLPYFMLVSVSPRCVSPSHGGFLETGTVNSRKFNETVSVTKNVT